MNERIEEIKAKLIRAGISKRAGGDGSGWRIQQKPSEAAAFLAWCEERGVRHVLELGTGDGGFAKFMVHKLGWDVTSVDLSRSSGIKEYNFQPIRNRRRHAVNGQWQFINASTLDAYPELYGQQFDLVFIDAGHSYEDVRRDWLLYNQFAPIVAFHDIAAPAAWADGVRKFWGEIEEEYLAGPFELSRARVFRDSNSPLGIGVIDQIPIAPRVNLSIITGTHQRPEMLKAMIESARRQIPASITYEFVISAQDCAQSTIDWLYAQPDVCTYAYPALRGGIRAFTDLGYAARGDYVLIANDDIVFRDGAIMRALSHIASTPTCGIVAFTPHPPGAVKSMPAQRNGQPVRAAYGETCLVPRWLGNWADWWGANTGMEPRARGLYGGDNFLSSKIWEAGYTVAIVDGAAIDDRKPDDGAWRAMQPGIKADAAQYRALYPQGPVIDGAPRFGERPRTLRILNLPLIANETSRASKHAEREALQGVGLVWELDHRAVPFEGLIEAARAWQPDLIFTQIHHAQQIQVAGLAALRAVAPHAVVINRNFDAQDAKHHSAEMRAVLKYADLQLHKCMSHQPRYDADGVRAAFWAEGYETRVGELPEVAAHDVVVQMNMYPYRDALKLAIEKLAGRRNVGMYGEGWGNPTGNTHLDFTTGEALYVNATIAIGDTFAGATGYMSRRVAQVMAAGGALLLLEHSPGLDEATGLEAGVHYIEWYSADEISKLITHWISKRRDKARRRIVEAAQAFAFEQLSCEASMRQLWFEILPEVFDKNVV